MTFLDPGQLRRGTSQSNFPRSSELAPPPNVPRYFRVPDFGIGSRRRRYYSEGFVPDTANYEHQGEITEYHYRKYMRSLSEEERTIVRLSQQKQTALAQQLRSNVARAYKARLAAYGIDRPLYRILQDPVFNTAYSLLTIRDYERRSGQELYPTMAPSEYYTYVIPTPPQVYSFFNTDIQNQLMLMIKEQLLIFLGMRRPTAQGTLGDPYGNNVGDRGDFNTYPEKSESNYTNKVRVPYYASLGVARYGATQRRRR